MWKYYRFGTNNVTATPVLRIRNPGWVKNQDPDPRDPNPG
jgi:hypothetical protein